MAPPPRLVGVAASVVVVASTTALVFPLRTVAPVVSPGRSPGRGAPHLDGLGPVAGGGSRRWRQLLAFNYFHIPPTGRFTIAESENWVALFVFVIVAVIGSSVAQLARTRAEEADQRRREADLAAETLVRLLPWAASRRRRQVRRRATAGQRARDPVRRDRARARGGRRAAPGVPAAGGDQPARHVARARGAAGGVAATSSGAGGAPHRGPCWRPGSNGDRLLGEVSRDRARAAAL